MTIRLIVLSLSILILGCNKREMSPEIEKGLLENQVLNVDGMDRNYHIYVPSNPSNAAVVVLLHGNGSNYDDLLGLSNVQAPYKVWLDLAVDENLIILAPNGTLGSNDKRGWNDCRNDAVTNPTKNDVLFVEELLDLVKTEYNANESKVYAVGTSNGGHFAIRLAEEIPNQITAFASIVASNAVNSQCSSSSVAVSALFINGTDDSIMPYEGGQIESNRGEVLSTENTISYWVEKNGTDAIPEVTNLPNIDVFDNSTATKFLYKNGQNDAEVALYEIEGGGHTEPSIAEPYSALYLVIVGNQNRDIEMADEVWNFFKTKSK